MDDVRAPLAAITLLVFIAFCGCVVSPGDTTASPTPYLQAQQQSPAPSPDSASTAIPSPQQQMPVPIQNQGGASQQSTQPTQPSLVAPLVNGRPQDQPAPKIMTSTSNGIEITYDAAAHEYLYPLENEVDRAVSVRNVGNAPAKLEFKVTADGPDGFSKNAGEFGIAPLPQPPILYLKPGENNTIYVIAGGGDLDYRKWVVGGNYTYNYTISVFASGNPSASNSAKVTNTVRVLRSDVSSIGDVGVPANAALSGVVVAADTGLPIPNAGVVILPMTFPGFRMVTDGRGRFSTPLVAYRRAEVGNYLDYSVHAEAPGYEDYRTAFVPKDGENVSLEIRLSKPSRNASYSLVASYNTKLNIFKGAASKDKGIIAIVPFHSTAATGEERAEYAYLHAFNKSGALLWKFKLYYETQAVDVNGDGTLVATSVVTGRPVGSNASFQPAIAPGIYLLDKGGRVVWNYTQGDGIDSINEVKFSHDGKYLAAGDNFGNAYFFEMATKKLLWHAFISGQITHILFESDDSRAYYTSGDGYVYAFDISGANPWRAYIDAWGYGMDVSKNYLVASAKTGYRVYALFKNGTTAWTAPVVHVGFNIVISPDESQVLYYGNAALTHTSAFDMRNGSLIWRAGGSNSGAMTSDGKYVTESGSDGEGNTFVNLLDRNGTTLWSASFNRTEQHPTGMGYSWISDDASTIVATVGEYAYFLKGGIANAKG